MVVSLLPENTSKVENRISLTAPIGDDRQKKYITIVKLKHSSFSLFE